MWKSKVIFVCTRWEMGTEEQIILEWNEVAKERVGW
jgi:hypothetical protein